MYRIHKKVVHYDRDGWGTLTEIRSKAKNVTINAFFIVSNIFVIRLLLSTKNGKKVNELIFASGDQLA